MRTRYVLITPCRDEEQFARRTLDSIERQTLAPLLWIVVDDGSSDRTPAILAEYAVRLPYLRVLRRDDRGVRSVGPGVIEAFYAGHEWLERTLAPQDYDYVCKFDLDLELPPDYFAELLRRMHAQPRLGTCSGKAWFPAPSGELVPETSGEEMSVGMVKLYDARCFREIGGFVRAVMWDGIDCHRARMLGWTPRGFDDEALRIVHLRPMGSSHKSLWTGRLRHGRGQHFMGTGPLYMAASAFFRMAHRPYVLGGLAMMLGYLGAALRGAPRYEDREFRAYLRRYQRACLLRGKRRATREFEDERASAWRPDAALSASPASATTRPSAAPGREPR